VEKTGDSLLLKASFLFLFLFPSVIAIEAFIRVPTPKTPTKQTTRDNRLHIQTLYYIAGWTVGDILLQSPRFTRRQVDYALQYQPTPQDIKGEGEADAERGRLSTYGG